MILAGQSKEDDAEFMVARYGDYVLFRPPVNEFTALLWFGPFALLALGLVYLFRHIRASAKSES